MSDNWDIDVDSEEYEDAPLPLRKAYKELKKQLTTVTTERDDFRSKFQTRSATDALSEFGFRNPKRVSRDLLADGVDILSNDAVKAWVEENGDDYARGEAAPAAEPQQPTADHTAEAQARQQMSQVQSSGDSGFIDKLRAAQAEITPDMDGAAVVEVYARHGI